MFRTYYRTFFSILMLLVIAHISSGQIPNYNQNCPNYPCKMTMDTNSFIPVTGDILLGSGIISRDNSGSGAYNQWRTMDYRIPCNKPSVAISMAHAWQLYRNIFKVPNYNINTFSGILINETSGGACQSPASLNFSCYPTSGFPFQNAFDDFVYDHNSGSGVAVHDGCYQIDGQGRQNLKEWFGTTECAIFSDLSRTESWITGNNIERNAIARVYYDLAFSRRVQYVMGVNPLPVISASNDPLGWYKVIAAAFNQGPNAIIPNVANRIFVTNRALAISSNNWFDPQLLGPNGYAQACTHYVKILSNNYTPANGSDQQRWTGWYDYNISWAEMDSYMTTIFVMYGLTAAEESAIRTRVQNVFNVQKDASGKVAFKTKFGPVIDELVKALPYHEPTNTINNSQMGDAGCKGCVGPVVRIKANTPTKVCRGLSVELETVYGAGYTYYWLKDEVLVTNPNPQQHIFFASQSGVYDVVVKDNKGCAIRSDGAVTVTIDNTCSSCNLLANGTITANSCSGITDGKIVVALSGSDYNSSHTFSYKWTFPNGSVITQSSNTLSNLAEGFYQLTVTDLSNPTCKAYQTFKIVETTPFYQTIDLTQAVQSCSSSKLTAIITDNPPANCSYKVWLEGVPVSGACWGQTWSASEWRLEIKINGVSIGSNVPVFTNGVCPTAQITFGANHGDIITVNFNNISSSAATGAFIYKLMDPKGNIITRNAVGMSFPGGSITNLITTTANCAQTTPSFNFTWTPSTGLSTPVNTSLTSNTTATVGSDVQYIVEAVTPSSPSCKLRDTVIVKYTCAPTCTAPTNAVTLTQSSPHTICSASGTINGTIGSSLSGIVYQWFRGGTGIGSSTAAISTPSLNVSSSGTYTLRIATSAANLVSSGCYKETTALVVTLTAAPVLTITNPAAVCSPATVDITAAAVTAGSTGGGTLSYWTNAAGTTALATPSAVVAGNTYYIKSTSGACQDIKPVVVTVNPKPNLVITNPTAVCSPFTVDITSAAVTAGSTGSGTLSYWTNAAGTTALATPSAVAIGNTYYIKSTAGTCTDIKPVVVTINTSPVLTITNPAAVCSPATVDITAAAVTAGSTGGGTLSYWTNAAGTTALATPSAVATGNTYYIKSTVGTCTDIKPVVVTITTSPVLTIINPPAVCSPATVDITAATITAGSTGSGTLSYWTNAAGTTALATPSAVATGGTYYIKSTVGTCSDIKPVVVSITTATSLVITDPTAACLPGTVDITATAVTAGSVGLGTLSYWTNAAGTTALATPSAVATGGTYYIKSTAGTCTDIKPVVVTITTGPSLTITNPAAVCLPATVNITAAAVTAGSSGGGTLSYWTNAAGTTALATPSAVATGGTYYIKSTAGTCTDIKPVVVTITTGPSLTITNPAGVCPPATIDLTAAAVTAGSTGGGALSYWTNAAATTALATPSAVTTGGTYYIKSTAGTCSDIKPVVVTFSTPGVASVTITESANSICAGTSVTFTAVATNGGSTPTYQWKVNNVAVGTAGTATTYTTTSLANNDKVTVEMTSNSGCVSGSPATSNQVTMIITAPVAPSVIINASSNPICSGQSVTFTATPTNGGTTPSYQWQLNGGPVGTNSATYSSATLTNGDQVRVIMTSTQTCITTPTATSSAVTMNITGTVAPAVTITADKTTICAGDVVTMTANPSNEGTTPSYQWKLNGGNVGTNSPTYTNNALTATDQVTVVLTSSLGCASPTTATSAAFSVTVNPAVAASVSVAPDQNSVCSGTSVTFTATPSNGGSTPSYQWYLNGGTVGTNSTTYSSSSFNNGDIVRAVMTSSLSCATGSPATSADVTMVINPKQTPTVGITQSVTSTCQGQLVIFTANSTNEGLTPSYQWKLNNINVGANSPGYSNSTLVSTDVLTLELTSSHTCVTTSTVTSAPVSVTITPTVVPSVTITPTTVSICEGSSVSFTATPQNGGTSPAYQWKVNGTNTGTGVSFSSTTLNNNDIVTVELTSSAGCASPLTATSTGVTVSVESAPSQPVFASPSSDVTICSGTQTITLQPISSGTVNWSISNSASISSTSSVSASASNMQAGNTYTVTATAESATNQCPFKTASIKLTIQDNIVVSISPNGALQECEGRSLNLVATISPSSISSPTIIWTKNGSDIPSATNQTYDIPSLTVADQGTYSVKVSTSACPAAVVPTQGLVLTIIPAPDAAIVQVNDTVTCIGNSAVIRLDNTQTGISYNAFMGGKQVGTGILGSGGMMYYTIPASDLLVGNGTVFFTGQAIGCNAMVNLTDDANLSVHPLPVAVAGADMLVSNFASIELNGTGSSSGTYLWTSSDPKATIVNPGSLITMADFTATSLTFTLTVTDESAGPGCYSSDTKTVEVDLKVKNMPNSFTPNSDGNHDTFVIPNIQHYPNAMVYFFNQWGELIYTSEPGYPKPWDGRRNGSDCEVGAYLMLIEFNQDNLPSIKETINLVR